MTIRLHLTIKFRLQYTEVAQLGNQPSWLYEIGNASLAR